MPATSLCRKLVSGLTATVAVSALVLGPVQAGESHSHQHMSADRQATGLVVTQAVSPAAPPGIKTSAVYLLLENAGDAAIDLVSVESPAFAMAHLHKTSTADGLMTMEPVAQLAIPRGETVMFAPGGLHIMLMGPREPLGPGDSFPLSLVFGEGQALTVDVAVVKPGELPATHDHSSMKMN
ncbi:copper chaperone PCu(A)C [Roseibium sp. Sym1]|uniref:copper chaperone PCu(A)C n=1 Tax=Roseibium sp. Sym1 TaxID=3016006 RepID=UPI0022B5B8FA|nr:copper chaperone PCu(A)C [Roseibium sp. Sym1]